MAAVETQLGNFLPGGVVAAEIFFEINTVKKMTTAEIVSDLRQKIASQTILPGTRIPEDEMALMYQIPRAKAREALAALEDRGLITRIPNRGAVVCTVDMEATYHLYQVREVLDGLAVRLATQNVPASHWDDISEMFGEPFETSLRLGDMDTHLTIIETFRERVKLAANNPVLFDMMDRLHDRTHVTLRRVALLPGRAEHGMAQYRSVLEAIRSGNSDQAEARIRELNQAAREYIERYKNYVI